MNEFFKNKFPFAYRYFSTLIEQVNNGERKFPQSIIFEGDDIKSQYLFSLELARLLNCQNKGEDNCDCINCKWIRSFSHPAVNNVSEIHFKGEKDTSKTVISIHQARQIEKTILVSSDYHRFFIFFSSDLCEYDPFELNDFVKLGYSTNIDYSFKPLTYDTFGAVPLTLNALLKSIEEPPSKVTFIFLTKSRSNILQTVVSRSFVFKLNSREEKTLHPEILDLFSNYPNFDYVQALEISEKILNMTKQNPTLSFEVILDELMNYLKDLILNNLNNEVFCRKLNRDIKFINNAIKMHNSDIQEKVALETLMLKIARGY